MLLFLLIILIILNGQIIKILLLRPLTIIEWSHPENKRYENPLSDRAWKWIALEKYLSPNKNVRNPHETNVTTINEK